MVSANSILTALTCRTSLSQNVGSYSTNTARNLTLPALLSLLQSHGLRPLANCLPLLVMATVPLCAGSFAGVAGIGVFPSHVLRLALKVLSSKV